MGDRDSGAARREVYRIIVHAAPPTDGGCRHWTEAPECPAAHESGATAEEAVRATMEGIRGWHAAHVGSAQDVEFDVEDTR